MEHARWRPGPMPGCRILLILLSLVDHGFSANAMITAQEYIELKQQQVQEIAKSALRNAKTSFEGDQCICSRAACFQTRSDVALASCVPTNTNCTCQTQAHADYTKKLCEVRMPGVEDENTILNDEVVAAICTQQRLDDVLLSRNFKYIYDDNIYYSFYLGTVDGAFRFFPGTSIEDCNYYDPRVRPWYIGAISVVKDLVVLVDVASSMTTSTSNHSNGNTAVGMAINMATQLLDTLTQGDRVTVMAYDMHVVSGVRVFVRSPTCRWNDFDPQVGQPIRGAAQQCQQVSQCWDNQLFQHNGRHPASSTSSGNAGSPTGALKVIVVLTNGQSPVPPDQPGLDDLVRLLDANYISLFVYHIAGNDLGLAGLATKSSLGRNEMVTISPSTVLNPLYTLKSYFSFLANARKSTGNGSFFWQPTYEDYNFLGLVRTVAYPAFSSAGLVGVAGIDIQVSKLNLSIAPEIERILNTEKVTQPPTISPAQIMTIGAMSDAGDSTVCNASSFPNTSSIGALCRRDVSDPPVRYPAGLCCSQSGCMEPAEPPANCSLSGCNEHKDPRNLTPLWICSGILPCLGLAGFIFWGRWKKRNKGPGGTKGRNLDPNRDYL